jgi:hypothetical protein
MEYMEYIKFGVISVIYVVVMYLNYIKIRKIRKEFLRFKESISRFTFIQFAFGTYELMQNKFDLSAFIYRVMFSHLGIAGFSLLQDYLK